jgi:multiple sugar transport system permease protein
MEGAHPPADRASPKEAVTAEFAFDSRLRGLWRAMRAQGARRQLTAFLLLLPAMVVLALALFYPIGVAIYSSFFDVEILNLDQQRFVGLANYARLITAASFWGSLGVTVIYTAVTVAGTYAVGLVSALLLRRRFRGRVVARAITVMPWAVPQVVAVLVWSWMLDANYGVVNYFLRVTHLIGHNLGWREEPHLAMAAVLFVTVWGLYPVATVMLLAGLHAIPEELYEAAAVDGAGGLGRFRHITLPGLAPVNLVLVLLLVLMAFTRVVTIIYVMTGGGPSGATETLPIQTYLQAFKFFHLGYASALGTVVLLIAVAFTVVYLGVGRRVYPEAGA